MSYGWLITADLVSPGEDEDCVEVTEREAVQAGHAYIRASNNQLKKQFEG
jgi:hypothetical protein